MEDAKENAPKIFAYHEVAILWRFFTKWLYDLLRSTFHDHLGPNNFLSTLNV